MQKEQKNLRILSGLCARGDDISPFSAIFGPYTSLNVFSNTVCYCDEC